MKKIFSLVLSMLLLAFTVSAFADEPVNSGDLIDQIRKADAPAQPGKKAKASKGAKADDAQKIDEQLVAEKRAVSASIAHKPRVAVIYVNNARTTFDSELDKVIYQHLNKALPAAIYDLVDGNAYRDKLNKMGYMDISTVERADFIDVFEDDDVDFCIYLEIQPMVAREKMTVFTMGKDITTEVPFKIIDLKNNKYIYVGKFAEKGSDSSVIGPVGNKSVAVKVVNSVGFKIGAIIEGRLPMTVDK